MLSSEALLYLGPSSAMKQWSTPLLPTGQCTQKHNHSAARQKYHSFHPPWVGERVGRPLYTHRPALTSYPQKIFFSSTVMFCLYHYSRMRNVFIWLQIMAQFLDQSHRMCLSQWLPISLNVLSKRDLWNHVKDLPRQSWQDSQLLFRQIWMI